MVSRLFPAVLAAAWTMGAGLATAEHFHHKQVVDSCAPCERTFNTTEVTLYETQTLVTVPDIKIKEIVTTVPTKGVDVEYKEEKRCVTVMVEKMREEERIVKSTSCIPETTIDPCTGCPCTTYRTVETCKTVKVPIYYTEPEVRTHVVKVPVLKCVDREVTIVQLTAVATSTAATCTKLNAAITDNCLTVPAAPCPAITCLPPLECKPGCCGGSCGAGHHK